MKGKFSTILFIFLFFYLCTFYQQADFNCSGLDRIPQKEEEKSNEIMTCFLPFFPILMSLNVSLHLQSGNSHSRIETKMSFRSPLFGFPLQAFTYLFHLNEFPSRFWIVCSVAKGFAPPPLHLTLNYCFLLFSFIYRDKSAF